LESYLGKLVSAGMRVAICEQMEDPRQAKGIVRREVTRVVTPGTLTDDALLDPRENNYLAAIVTGEPAGLAWVELSTGRFFAATFPQERLLDQLARIEPAECLVSEDDRTAAAFGCDHTIITVRPPWTFAANASAEALARHFGTASLEGFGIDTNRDAAAVRAAGAIVDYLGETQKSSLAHIDRLIPYRASETLEIDESSRRSLEITRTLRDGRRDGALLGVLDQTKTPMGARLLADWLANPLTCRERIEARQGAVAELVADPRLTDDLRDKLRGIYDLERLLARVITARATPRDLGAVARTLASLPAIKAKLTERKSPFLNDLEASLDLCPELRAKLDSGLVDDCPHSSRDGGFIRPGFHAELDNLRELTSGGKQWIARYQSQEIERTGIPSLKVGFNKVFGYYLEVTHTHGQKVPDHYIRKQTVKNAERYITPELKEYEEKVLSADEKAKELEYDLFCQLRDLVANCARRLQATAAVLAQLDVLTSLATLARERGYCRPIMTDEPTLKIVDGRHPVVDALAAAGSFVPNDTTCGGGEGLILLITGPNMAGKSTYIRQVALITVLAQIGSFVPAREATIGIADRIFARVGASDELARGQSTFMVEMTETARILNLATSRSLVILDEIGRGTSTYDGVSLAWAIVEHLHDVVNCRTLFATHYHELTDLAKTLTSVRNLNVAVREWDEQLVFLHKIVEGAADKSYGIHVARLAGVPREVNERAKQILSQLEQEHLNGEGQPKIASRGNRCRTGDLQLTLFAPYEHPLLERLRSLDLNDTTPLAALQMLQDWQRELAQDKKKP
jgi:DNA mismatch repair protein MutS